MISIAVAAAGWVVLLHPEITPPSNFHHLRDTTTASWLLQLGSLRREYVHHMPYGIRYDERFGIVEETDPVIGMHVYRRPVLLDGKKLPDLMKLLAELYLESSKFFIETVELSGFDSSIIKITDTDL